MGVKGSKPNSRCSISLSLVVPNIPLFHHSNIPAIIPMLQTPPLWGASKPAPLEPDLHLLSLPKRLLSINLVLQTLTARAIRVSPVRVSTSSRVMGSQTVT